MGGSFVAEMPSANTLPTPLWISISLNAPPEPMIKIIIPAGASALALTSSNCFRVNPLRVPRK